MADYTLAVGTHDPYGFAAGTEQEAVRQAIGFVHSRYADDLECNSQDVVTLLGPEGLVTRPAERLDEFVRRMPGASVVSEAGRIQPGDTNIPDCNGD